MKTLDKYAFKNATCVTMQTLIGVSTRRFPVDHGNCFSIKCDNNIQYKIVNFVLENLERLVEKKIINWPIRILPISERHAVIIDERIPEKWYSKKYCEVCCPFDLLPHNQKMSYVRKLLTKEIEEIECQDGSIIVKREFKTPPQRTLKPGWTVQQETDSGIIYCDSIPVNLKKKI